MKPGHLHHRFCEAIHPPKKIQAKKTPRHVFFKIFPCATWEDYTDLARTRPRLPLSPRTGPPHTLFSVPAAKPRLRAPETQKGGKISPAAKRFPLSPLREAVKPPLFVPGLRDRLLGELSDGQPIGFDPGEDRLDDVRGETVQGKDAADVAGFSLSAPTDGSDGPAVTAGRAPPPNHFLPWCSRIALESAD